jgi:hypothetical protein
MIGAGFDRENKVQFPQCSRKGLKSLNAELTPQIRLDGLVSWKVVKTKQKKMVIFVPKTKSNQHICIFHVDLKLGQKNFDV